MNLSNFLDVVDGIDWGSVPIEQARRGSRRQDNSPGRTSPNGDFVWYDPFRNVFVNAEEARTATQGERRYADDFPTGFRFVSDNGLAQRIAAASVPMEEAPTFAPVVHYDIALPVVYVRMKEAPTAPTVDELAVVRSFLVRSGVSVAGVETLADAKAKLASFATPVPPLVLTCERTDVSVADDRGPDSPVFDATASA